MNVWSKMLTALRGGANEVGEAVVDSQALRILDQEIRDADVELRKSKEALAEIMAKQKLASDKVNKSAASIGEYEQYALKALEAGNETLAKEVADHALTATVIASEDEELCLRVQQALHGRTFRVYASADRFGVELGGALKNVYAIMSGMAAALGMGENTKSMLITRALAEMTRFAVKLGANPMTFLGLAGVGDLIVTCSSPKSRNYQVGFALGEGLSLEEAVQRLGEVAEGVNTLKVLKARAEELDVYMPLVAGLHAILFEGRTLAQVIELLMLGEPKTDVDFIPTAGF